MSTVGYVGAIQSENGVIQLVTSRNHPDLHIELNEAWILADDEAAEQAALEQDIKVIPETIKAYKEEYPNGKLRVSYGAGTGRGGRFLLEGSQIWYYENGQKEWEASYRAGTRVGAETHWNPDGTKKWRRVHREDGSYVLTIWGAAEKVKATSVWRDKKLISHELTDNQPLCLSDRNGNADTPGSGGRRVTCHSRV
ncbi:MAG: toxin-antitoxin system YwqK family antitoxin [Planctomycetota bacterium]